MLEFRRPHATLQAFMLHSRIACAVAAVAFGASIQSSTAWSPRALGPDCLRAAGVHAEK